MLHERHGATAQDRSRVFVVHGRDENLRRSLFDFLRAIGLKPIEWSQALAMASTPSPYIGDILDAALRQAQAIVVLLTGDDEGRLRQEFSDSADPPYEHELIPQPRLNVLFEAGLALGRYPQRTVLVQAGRLKPFSDLAGKYIIRLHNSTRTRQELALRLKHAGCPVDLSGTDWQDAGFFSER